MQLNFLLKTFKVTQMFSYIDFEISWIFALISHPRIMHYDMSSWPH